MTLDELAAHYLEQGYRAACDGALICPNGAAYRGLIRHGGTVYLPEQIGWRIRELAEARARRSDGTRDLTGLVLTTTPRPM